MKVIDLSGKGAAIDGTENDNNLSSLSGINSPITATTHTIDVDDQNDTIEYSNASAIAVTLPTIASVSGSNIHTDDFKVILKNIGAGVVTVTRGGTDTFEDGSTSITVNQYDCVTIQTDNSLTKWNIINEVDADHVTLTGTEILTNKTLTSPAINTPTVTSPTVTNPTVNGQSGYGLVMLDTPDELISTTTLDDGLTGSWHNVDMSALYAQAATDGAVIAKLKIYLNCQSNSFTSTKMAAYVRKTGLSGAVSDNWRASRIFNQTATSANVFDENITYIEVALDSNSDFEYQMHGAFVPSSQALKIYLVGYYV